MKKGFKIFLCVFLVILVIVATLPIVLSLPLFASKDGLSFSSYSTHVKSLDKAPASAPITLFATVKIASSVATPGVIFGNYKNSTTPYINFEVVAGGLPSLSFTNTDGTVTTVTFYGNDIRTGEFVNLAIVFTDATSVSLYVNGEFKGSREVTASYATDANASTFVVGGDNRSSNTSYFNGNIKNLAIYSVALDDAAVSDLNTNGIDAEADNVLACYDMTTSVEGLIKDLSGNGCDASGFYQRITSPTNYAYSFAVIGDTQTAVYEDVSRAYKAWKNGDYDTLEEAMAAQKRTSYMYDWIVKNKDSKKIEYVFGVGDITECRTSANFNSNGSTTWTWDNEFQHAKNQIIKLDDAGIPYALVPGDHDEANRYALQGTGFYTNNGTRDYSKFASYFDELLSERVTGYYNDPAYPNSYSYYINFEAGSTQYMLLALEVGAPNRVLDWANEVVAANPDRRVIVLTHAFLNKDGDKIGIGDGGHNTDGQDGYDIRNNGEQMWDEFVKLHNNISLVISGHIASSDIVSIQEKGDNGNIVTQILVDPQYMQPSYGMVCMLYFSEDGNDVQVEWISTGSNEHSGYIYRGKDFLYKAKNQFSFSVLEDGNSKLASYADLTAILSNNKLYTNGLITYTNYDKWTIDDRRNAEFLGNSVSTTIGGKIYGSASGTYLEMLKDKQGTETSTTFIEKGYQRKSVH